MVMPSVVLRRSGYSGSRLLIPRSNPYEIQKLIPAEVAELRKLQDAMVESAKVNERLTRWVIGLTLVLVLATFALVGLTIVLVFQS